MIHTYVCRCVCACVFDPWPYNSCISCEGREHRSHTGSREDVQFRWTCKHSTLNRIAIETIHRSPDSRGRVVPDCELTKQKDRRQAVQRRVKNDIDEHTYIYMLQEFLKKKKKIIKNIKILSIFIFIIFYLQLCIDYFIYDCILKRYQITFYFIIKIRSSIFDK